jgi:hypothetical protein
MRLVFVVLAMVPLLTGCELLACSGPEYLSFAVVRYSVLPGGTQGVGATAPRWGANEAMNPTDEIQIVFPEGDTLPVDVLELVASDGTPVAFSGEDMFVPTNTEACAHNERHYALDTLAAGNYTLIHRRENGTGDPLNCIEPECPWTTFDGSQVVQLTLTIR